MSAEVALELCSGDSKRKYSWDAEELENFRKAVINDKHLNRRTDDIFLLAFLRARKYDRARALKLLRNYYDTRKRFTNIFTDLNPTALEGILNAKIMQSLPQISELDPTIAIGRASHWDTSRFSWKELIRCVFLIGDLALNDHILQKNGAIVLIDAKSVNMEHVLQFTPTSVYTIVSSAYGSYPVRYKEFHVVNVNKFIHMILAILLPFLPYKLKKRIHIHGSNMEKLHKRIPPKYLPAEFGGDLPSFDPTECNNRLRENEALFIENEKYWKMEN